jgi:hypothetical protein
LARHRQQAMRQQVDVKTRLVVQRLGKGQQVRQQRGNALVAQAAGYMLVAWAVPAAAGAVCEQHDADRLRRHLQHGFNLNPVNGDVEQLRTHGLAPFWLIPRQDLFSPCATVCLQRVVIVKQIGLYRPFCVRKQLLF